VLETYRELKIKLNTANNCASRWSFTKSFSLSRNRSYWIWGDSISCSVGTTLLFHGRGAGA
jgi:hypothetical protein